MQRSLRLVVLAVITAATLAITPLGTAPMDAHTETLHPQRQLDNPVDRDGDGQLGEAEAIRQRVRAYLERHGEHGVINPQDNLRKARWAYERSLARRTAAHAESISGEGWISLGPNNGAGRFTALAPHPTVDGTLLAGAAGGGVWRTTDDGESWIPLTDGIPDLSVGAVAYAPSDPDVVYLGTGEGGYAIDFIPGIGLLRSEDGGDTWILPEQVVATNFYRISVDPRDPDVLVCGTNEGLIRSVDGGVTWSVPIPNGASSGGNVMAVTDVARGSADPDLLYAALWCRDACPSGTARIMRSTDNGVTWAPAATGLPAPDSDWSRNRLGLALAPGDDGTLYVATNIAGDDGGAPPARIYRTTNRGQSWTATTNAPAYLGAQGWYDNAITVSPSSNDMVVAGGVWYLRSITGGNGWSEQNPYEQAGLPHVDVHDLQWQGSTLWVANDGGVWKSENGGATWTDCNSGLITRQYYGIAIDPVHRERVIAGAQDNGTNRRRDAGDDSWDDVLGGDGFECAINPLVPSIAYATIYNTSIYRSLAGGAPRSFTTATPYYGADENAPFITPLTMRPDTPWVLYTGTDRVWRTENAADSWQPLPTTVTDGTWNDVEIWSVAVTAADPDAIMVAKGADVYRSTDGGSSWVQSPKGAAGGLPGKRVVNVEISPFDPDIALACLAGQSSGDLYRTSDGGLTWTQSDSGLPPFSVQVARWDPTDPAVVFAGTDVGLYRSTDGGVTWQAYGEGLPAASVHDIRVLPDGSMLRVGTHGRGVWELDIPSEANTSPSVEITSPTSSLSLTTGQSASFTASANDPDGDALSATWLFTDHWRTTDGGSGSGALETTRSHTFDLGGTYLATVSVDDGRGGRGSAALTVNVDDPANDCKSPRIVPPAGPFPFDVEISNAAAYRGPDDPSPPCVSDPRDSKAGTWGSMWFEFTPAESHRYSLSTCGSGADTVLSVWTGAACGPYTPVADGCNDDDESVHCDGGRTDSYVELNLEAGTTYRIMVASYANNSKGRIGFQLTCSDCSPPPVERLYIVPAAAHTGGVGGTTWVTDLDLSNPGTTQVGARLAFLPAGGNNASASEVEVQVPAGGSLELADVVAGTLDATGSGALRVRADGDLLVTSRTYNDAASGTYGQFIPGTAADAGLTPSRTQLLAGLESNDAFRTNIGIANASDSPATATIDLFAADGTPLGSQDVSLARWGWTQLNGVFSKAGVSDLALGYALVRNTSTSAILHAYASVVDGRTGDPTYVDAAPSAIPGEPVWIAAAAHTGGVNGSVWRTDLVLTNPLSDDPSTGEDALVTLELHLPSGEILSSDTTVPMGSALRLGDVVATAFGASGAGAIRVVANQGRATAVSRTYNQAPGGTYGQFIPGALAGDALTSGDEGLLLQLRRTSGFRTNVGFVNLTANPLRIRADYYRADGSLVGTRHYTVTPYAYFQQTNAIPGTEELAGITAAIRAETSDASYLAYASVVDNASGDPVFVPAVRPAE